MNYQDRFIRLVKEITQLQWVRESLPSHSKYYEGLKKKLDKQTHLKSLSEKELKEYQIKQDNNNNKLFNQNTTIHGKSYSNIIESVKFYENAIQSLQAQIDQAEEMLRDLNSEKEKLNNLCSELNELYEQLIIDEDPNAIFGQHLKRDVEQLAVDIPNIKKNIELYETAQAKLYKAREYIESAMKSLPGASTFLDRQAIVANYNNKSNLFGNKRPLCMMDSIHSSDEIASRSCELVAEASLICPDVPLIPMSVTPKMDVVSILTHYRGYRLKIESVLRTRLNPRLHGYKNQFASAKYHYEQRVIEWVDHQIITLEAYLRSNGCLLNDDLNREISMLRMGSRAAIAAVASETSERVTVDDVLEISLAEGSALPEYALIEPNNSSSSSSDSSTSSHLDESDPIHPSSVNACVNNSTNIVHHDLPSYTIHEHPPAYSA